MNKAEELLSRYLYKKEDDYKLWGETLDYLNRKDKLVEGSEWVCEVDCYHRHGEHDSGNIILVNELMGNDVRYSNSKEDLCEMTIDQFLVCFKPLERKTKCEIATKNSCYYK